MYIFCENIEQWKIYAIILEIKWEYSQLGAHVAKRAQSRLYRLVGLRRACQGKRQHPHNDPNVWYVVPQALIN